MSFLNSMQNRYTTKKYNPNKKINSETINELKEILNLSPSSINSQPWKFTLVSNQKTKEQLSKVSWLNAGKVIDCDTVVVFSRIDNISLFEKQIEKELPAGAVSYFKEFIKPQSEEQIKSWFGHQLYLSLGVFLSACAEMGIDATPMEGIEPDNYNTILELENYHTMVAVAIGYRDPEDNNQPSKRPKSRRNINQVVETI
ncbi:NAD(P)H-dependent oxidoreductase [Aquimarina sp. MMG015]|uniref:NAD(P)H-dependent oxidoreductase n=1 Tax=Aquimarina TaxID=290174 RepID=UPI00047FF3EE|nr:MULTISPECIES: NAD(P)H-dependent oxidoreductase [Aquimarina]MBQ4803828.1 NAD(P)H-dependent oxidoreductase [Aquimarina sp. MMG015]